MEEKKEEKSRYGLSIQTAARGFLVAPDNFVMCGEIFDLLFERFDEELMKKRIEREFKAYSIHNAIQTTMNAVNMQTITNDIGDDFSKRPDIAIDSYNYDEETMEPAIPKMDSYGAQGRMADPKEHKNRFTIEQFNLLLHAIRDGKKPKDASEIKGRRLTHGSPGKLSIPSASVLRADQQSSASRRHGRRTSGRASSMSNASRRLRSDY